MSVKPLPFSVLFLFASGQALAQNPNPTSITPNSGVGYTTSFTAVYSDPYGAGQIDAASLSVTPYLGANSACTVSFEFGLFWLTNDTGTALFGPLTPGSSNTISNSQCALSGQGSSATPSGNTLSVTFKLTFSPSYAGSKQMWMYVSDSTTGLNSGFQNFGSWTVGAPQPPAVTSLSPPPGTGLYQSFTATYSDVSGGGSQIDVATIAIVPYLGATNACVVGLEFGFFWLTNDAATGLVGPLTPLSSGTISNSQCTVSGQGASFNASGNNLTFTVPITFNASFSGTQQIWMYTSDAVTGLNSGWHQMGTWTVGVASPDFTLSTPQSQSITAGHGSSFQETVVPRNGFNSMVTFNQPSWPSGLSASFLPGSTMGSTTMSITSAAGTPAGTYPLTFSATGGGITRSASVNVTVQGTPPPLPPSAWKAVNYSPRRHSYFRMLYDWNTIDSGTGQLVSSMVNSDLATLQQNGFNVLHLYLWDHDWLLDPDIGGNPGEPAGFIGPAGDPSQSPNSQWANLNSFVTLAESHGLYVALHFASLWYTQHCPGAQCATDTNTIDNTSIQPYVNWVGSFIRYLTSTNHHSNVLLWGMGDSLSPVPGCTALTNPPPAGQCWNPYSYVWAKTYYLVDQVSRQYSPQPGALGLVGADLDFKVDLSSAPGMYTAMIVRQPSTGYVFKWQDSQTSAATMRSLLSQLYGVAKDPDSYLTQIYHANSLDLYNGLVNLTANGSFPVQATKLFVVEFATSSSLATAGNGIPTYGDNDDPTMTANGQAAWLQNTLCALRGTQIAKQAYWSLYDPFTLWSSPPWSLSGDRLAWPGYWGLAYEQEGNGYKPAWSTLLQYYYNPSDPSGNTYGNLGCPSSLANVNPILSLTPARGYYTVSQPVRVIWTAAEIASLNTNGNNGTYTCDTGDTLSSNSLVAASCAYTDVSPFQNTGTQTVTITGTSVGNFSQTASATVSIGLTPLVYGVLNQYNSSSIQANDTIQVFGDGFSVTPINAVQLVRPGYDDVWFYDGDGSYFWDQSFTQINASLSGRLAPGTWTLYVRNGYTGNPSTGFQIIINP